MDNSSSDIEPLPLGAFDLFEQIGKGGMGAVFRGRHRPSSTDVAVKVLLSEADERAVRRFHREVRAHAALLHPSIVELVDYGVISDAAALCSAGQLRAGGPYVVMELADAGTVSDLRVNDWPTARAILEQVLGGLAYAHARGVVHRDLKPANLLVFGADRATIKLADFGIAHALHQIEERGPTSLKTVIGTPRYMAPEQLLGRWRDHGPWTDIYSVGCIAYLLLTGSTPFTGKGLHEVLARLNAGLPDLDPRFPIPAEMERWIQIASNEDPDCRFRAAADALHHLPPADAECATVEPSTRPAGDWDTATIELYPTTQANTESNPTIERPQPSGPGTQRPLPPPAGGEWSAGHPEPSAITMGAGLELFRLREAPLVGRVQLRRELWDSFVRTGRGEGLEVIMLRGGPGHGKSRLAQALCRRAQEFTGAHILRFSDLDRDQSGLQALLRTWHMTRDEIHQHLRRSLPPLPDEGHLRALDAVALTEILNPSTSGAQSRVPPYHFTSQHMRFDVYQRLLTRLSLDRPTVVWFDDIHDSDASIALLEHLLASDSAPSVLIVATVRTDVVASDTVQSERFAALLASSKVRATDLEPLPPDEARLLAHVLAPIPEAVAERLVERMEGNPLFGVQLLTDWFDRGLADEETGAAKLPADIHAIWLQRIARLAGTLEEPDRFRDTLMLAATLGKSVSTTTWAAVVNTHPATFPSLWDLLVSHGLAQPQVDGWSFVHGLLVESLRREAEETSTPQRLHEICAEALELQFAARPFEHALPLAEHWLAAGQSERALRPLAEEAERLRHIDDYEGSLAIMKRRSRLLDEIGAPPDDPVRIDNDLTMLRDSFRLGTVGEDARPLCLAHLEKLEQMNEPVLTCKACWLIAVTHEAQGQYELAKEYAERSRAAGARGDDAREHMIALLRVTRLHRWHGDLSIAAATAREVSRIAGEVGDDYFELRASLATARIHAASGEPDQARELFEHTLQHAMETGYPFITTTALEGLGDVAAQQSRHEASFEYYGRSVDIFMEMNQADDAALVSASWATSEVIFGRYEEARARIDWVARVMAERGYGLSDGRIALVRLVSVAALGSWDEFDVFLEAARGVGFGDDPSAHQRLASLLVEVVREAGDAKRLAGAEAIRQASLGN